MIVIADYGLGNIKAFENAYRRLNIACRRATTRTDLAGATKLVLPGVGAFDHAMERLEAADMRAALEDLVMGRGIPILGICVGMQMLARASEEGKRPGLGWIDAAVERIRPSDPHDPLPLPHMGWNSVRLTKRAPLFDGIDQEAEFYFLHSYRFSCAEPDDEIATVEYGSRFTCAVQREHIYGLQFHPEKSHRNGGQVLKNFAEL